MIQVYPAQSRFTADHGWLKSNFSFSFAEFYDPANVQFGCMRVLNDDWVAANKGFGAHPHREMEIVSIVLSGELLHQDNMGHQAVTTWGGIQRMSAGTGVVHAELNPSPTEPVTFLQMWFHPETQGIDPSYEQTTFDLARLKNVLLPVVSKGSTDSEVADIHQELTIYLSELDAGKALTFNQQAPRDKAFVFVLKGSIEVNGTVLQTRDSARITDTPDLTFQASEDAQFMLIDMV
jgi:redox-sensitive bicupin YhaK (pirin superfamily)